MKFWDDDEGLRAVDLKLCNYNMTTATMYKHERVLINKYNLKFTLYNRFFIQHVIMATTYIFYDLLVEKLPKTQH